MKRQRSLCFAVRAARLMSEVIPGRADNERPVRAACRCKNNQRAKVDELCA